MKKKFFLIMIPLYFAVFAAVLFLNGVFNGEQISVVNLVINILFMLLIGISIIVSINSLSRMVKAADELGAYVKNVNKRLAKSEEPLWKEFLEKGNDFDNPILAENYDKYLGRIKRNIKRAWRADGAVSVEEYINEGTFEVIGKAQFNSALPGLFTGLGILGTFLGLSFGMMSFSGDDIFTISDNIGSLLGGMKVAFHTSVYGMLFSLVFTIVYRETLSYVYEKLGEFIGIVDEFIAPSYDNEADSISAMLMYQSQMLACLENLVSLMEGNAGVQSDALAAMMERFSDRVSRNASADFKSLGVALENTAAQQKRYTESIGALMDNTRLLLESCQMMRDSIELSCQRDEEVRGRLISECERLKDEIYTLGISRL